MVALCSPTPPAASGSQGGTLDRHWMPKRERTLIRSRMIWPRPSAKKWSQKMQGEPGCVMM